MSGQGLHRLSAAFAVLVLAAGCAVNPPRGLEAVPEAPGAATVQGDPERYRGQVVRWGGEILDVHNRTGLTEVEVYSRPLYDNAEPRPEGGDGVRFIARIGRFLDPVEYQPGRRLTVRGKVQSAVTRAVGEYPYVYPVVDAETHHLWPKYEPPPDPLWYRDPFYDPWWPWGPWGYHPWYRPYGW